MQRQDKLDSFKLVYELTKKQDEKALAALLKDEMLVGALIDDETNETIFNQHPFLRLAKEGEARGLDLLFRLSGTYPHFFIITMASRGAGMGGQIGIYEKTELYYKNLINNIVHHGIDWTFFLWTAVKAAASNNQIHFINGMAYKIDWKEHQYELYRSFYESYVAAANSSTALVNCSVEKNLLRLSGQLDCKELREKLINSVREESAVIGETPVSNKAEKINHLIRKNLLTLDQALVSTHFTLDDRFILFILLPKMAVNHALPFDVLTLLASFCVGLPLDDVTIFYQPPNRLKALSLFAGRSQENQRSLEEMPTLFPEYKYKIS